MMPPVSSRSARDDAQYLNDEAGMPADSTSGAHCNNRDFGVPLAAIAECYTKLLQRGRRFLARNGRTDWSGSCPLSGAYLPRRLVAVEAEIDPSPPFDDRFLP
jgi:hypothetical protein